MTCRVKSLHPSAFSDTTRSRVFDGFGLGGFGFEGVNGCGFSGLGF